MSIFEIHTKDTAEQKKIVKTSIVGFCYGCQTMHYKGEQYKEDGATWCKHTGRLVDTSGFHPPIPIEIPQEWLDNALAGPDAMVEDEPELPTRAEQIADHLEGLADLFEIDIAKHQKHWEYLVSQFIALADTKQPRVAKQLNKAALGTQLTLLSQDDEGMHHEL